VYTKLLTDSSSLSRVKIDKKFAFKMYTLCSHTQLTARITVTITFLIVHLSYFLAHLYFSKLYRVPLSV